MLIPPDIDYENKLSNAIELACEKITDIYGIEIKNIRDNILIEDYKNDFIPCYALENGFVLYDDYKNNGTFVLTYRGD